MERERRLALVAGAAVIIAAVATMLYGPSGTTVPLPEPTAGRNNGTAVSSEVEVVAENLEVPWAIDISEDGRIFFTERAGRIRIIDDGRLLDPIHVNAQHQNEAGLMGIALHPEFTDNHKLYVYHTYSNGTAVFNKVVMFTEQDNRLIDSATILDGIPAADRNDGGRIKFGPDGKLYIATGDARQPELAQNADSLAGKILRINDDGSIPEDNPFPGSPVYSLGHRNVQGLAWHPDTGELYASEHGETGNDEINLIKPGVNYGWPLEECNGTLFEGPVRCFSPAIAPGGIAIPSSNELGYRGDILISSLRGTHVRQVNLETGESNNVLTGFGRIRDVFEGSDGSIYVLTSNRDGRAIPGAGDDKILRITAISLSG
jgi:aldose sugar dehydrogenase